MSLRSQIRRIKAILFPFAQKKNFVKLKNRVVVATHHKAGTVWLHNVFLRVCQELGLKFYKGIAASLPNDFNVFVPGNSRVHAAEIPGPFQGLHMIRDPRDIIISGCFYHQKAPEKWLHTRHRHFGGLSYQEKLNSYPSLDDRILFEMEHAGRPCIQELLAWNYDDPAFLEVKYENLIADEQLVLFHTIFAFLGFPGIAMPRALRVAYENSLFSGVPTITSHIRSGKPKQWEQYFSSHHRARFIDLFGDALQRLGYESSDAWTADAPRQTIPITRPGDVRKYRRAA
jgi:hypothetical protein